MTNSVFLIESVFGRQHLCAPCAAFRNIQLALSWLKLSWGRFGGWEANLQEEAQIQPASKNWGAGVCGYVASGFLLIAYLASSLGLAVKP